MKARKWLAGLLSVVMLITTVAPAAAAGGGTDTVPAEPSDVPSLPALEEVAELFNASPVPTGRQIRVSCIESGSDHPDFVKYDVEPSDITLGEIQGDAESGYTVEATIDYSRAIGLYCEANGPHEPDSVSSESTTRVLEHNGEAWVRENNNSLAVQLVHVSEEPAPEAGSVWGPGGENWKIQLTLVCENPEAVHEGGNSTKPSKKNFLSESDWDWENAELYQTDGVWYAACTLKGAELLDEAFGGTHTATGGVDYVLVYENEKWCIDTEAEIADVVVTGTCTESGPAAPALGENLDVWVQLYADDGTRKGSQIDRRPTQYGPSVSFGEPYAEEGVWKCEMTVIGHSDDPEMAEHCYVDQDMPEGYELADEAVKAVTITYDQSKGEWVCPEIPKEHLTSASTAKYGVSFKIREVSEETVPAAPSKEEVAELLNTTGIATGKEITISCTDGHASEKYPVQPEDVTVGEVEKDETYGYIVEVTVDMSRAVELFCQANGPHEVHTGYEMQSGCTLQYNSDKAAWVRNAKLGFGFFQVQLDDSEPEEPAPEAGNVYGPGGENWKIQLTLVCENPEAVHEGGNSTKAKKRNYIAQDQWDWAGAEFYKEGDVWYAECALDGSELLEEQFGAGHTAEKQTYTLVHENGKWCIDTEAELADVVITGVCEEKGPAAPVLGENLDVWIQVYGDGETPKSGMQLGSYPQYAGSVTCGAPYEEEGAWKSGVTVVGYTEEPEEGVRYYLNERMPEGYELAEAGTKTVTAIFDQATGEWMCPEIPKEQMQANAKTQYGVSFKIQEISEEPAPEAGSVWGPGGENWKIQLTLVCENPEAVHEGGNSTKASKKNFLSESDWDWENAELYQADGVWYAVCTLKGAELLDEAFGGTHTATGGVDYVLVYENEKWCIDTEAEIADVVVTGTCTESGPAAPVLGENLDVWVQLYADDGTRKGSQIDRRPTQYGPSVSFGEPYAEEGVWKCEMTVIGHSDDPEMAEHCYVDQDMPEGYELADEAVKAVTITYDQSKGEWVCPEIPKEHLTSASTAKYGVSFKIREVSEEPAPEAPNKDNCTDLSVTVYGASPRADGSTWNAMIVSGRWDMYPDTAKVSFGEPVQGADGVWTCEATVDAEARIAEAIESMSNSHYRDDETDPNTKTIVLTYDESNGKWRAPSDGVAYSTGTAARNGVAFRLIEQYVITYAPGRDTSLGIPEGETYESEPHDAGELVTLPTEPGFTTENGYFAGWKHSEDGVTEFYAPGAEIPMFAGDTELEAYWMDVTVQVATEPYDADKAAEDYTFTDEGNAITVEGEDVTLLYKATIKGNNKYPYELVCQDAQAAYGTELSGVFGFGTTSVTVYFTKNYVLPGSTTIQEMVGLSGCAAADTVSTAVTVTSEEPGPSTDLTEEDIRALLENVELVTLRCTNSDYDHESVTYTLRDGFSFQKDSETVYTVTIHLDEDGYLDAYDSAEGRTHDTVGDADYSFQITWVDGAWTVPDAPAVIQVRCTSPSGGGSDSDDREQEHSSTVITGGSDEDRDDSGESNGGTVIDDNETPLAPGVFTDVPAGHWASEAVTFVTGRGIFTGTSATTFSPDMVMSRAMLATVLWRMEGQPAPGSASPFTDVPAGQWYTDAVVWAAGEGVVKGIGNDLFDPDGLVTREQMATMLYRYAGSPAVTGGALTGYGDQAQVSDFALQAMEWAVSQGILTGKPGSLLDPQGGVTRAEVAVILMRYIQGQEG